MEYVVRLEVRGTYLAIAPWFSFSLAASALLILLLVLMLVHVSRSAQAELDRARSALESARATADSLCAELERVASSRARRTKQTFEIVRHLHPPKTDGRKAFEEVLISVQIDADGSATVNRRDKVIAVDKTLHYFEHEIYAEEDAPGMRYAEDIRFSVRRLASDPKKKVAWLPIDDGPHSKSIAVFPLPPVLPTEESAREIETTYHWSQMMKQLLLRDEEAWHWTMRSGRLIPFVRIEMLISPGLGLTGCTLIGQPAEGADGHPQKIESPTLKPD